MDSVKCMIFVLLSSPISLAFLYYVHSLTISLIDFVCKFDNQLSLKDSFSPLSQGDVSQYIDDPFFTNTFDLFLLN